MQFKELFAADESDRAVSPVIGVILMVAITVILAAVIGTFVLGLGDQVQQTSPNAQWNWDQSGTDQLDLTHQGGDTVDVARLEVTQSGSTGAVENTCTALSEGWDTTTSDITAGNTCAVVDGSETVGGTYRLLWSSEGGGSSSTLSTYEAQ